MGEENVSHETEDTGGLWGLPCGNPRGRLRRPSVMNGLLESRMPRKCASPVRRGAVGKGPLARHLAGCLPYWLACDDPARMLRYLGVGDEVPPDRAAPVGRASARTGSSLITFPFLAGLYFRGR